MARKAVLRTSANSPRVHQNLSACDNYDLPRVRAIISNAISIAAKCVRVNRRKRSAAIRCTMAANAITLLDKRQIVNRGAIVRYYRHLPRHFLGILRSSACAFITYVIRDSRFFMISSLNQKYDFFFSFFFLLMTLLKRSSESHSRNKPVPA